MIECKKEEKVVGTVMRTWKEEVEVAIGPGIDVIMGTRPEGAHPDKGRPDLSSQRKDSYEEYQPKNRSTLDLKTTKDTKETKKELVEKAVEKTNETKVDQPPVDVKDAENKTQIDATPNAVADEKTEAKKKKKVKIAQDAIPEEKPAADENSITLADFIKERFGEEAQKPVAESKDKPQIAPVVVSQDQLKKLGVTLLPLKQSEKTEAKPIKKQNVIKHLILGQQGIHFAK
jgi:hypothetical protein